MINDNDPISAVETDGATKLHICPISVLLFFANIIYLCKHFDDYAIDSTISFFWDGVHLTF